MEAKEFVKEQRLPSEVSFSEKMFGSKRKTYHKEADKGYDGDSLSFELHKGCPTAYHFLTSNAIRTSKFTYSNLIPKTLYLNFSRLGNLTFLIISIIMLSSTEISPYYQWIIPFQLFFFVIFNIMKELLLDFQRKKFDNTVNMLPAKRGHRVEGDFQDCHWKDLRVGDIVYLRKEDMCPADVVVLDTSESRNSKFVCYVDTSAIDGKSQVTRKNALNLTQRPTTSALKHNFQEYRKIITGKIDYEPSTNNINSFSGFFKLKRDPKNETMTIKNLILRGSTLKQTEWIMALVVYAGNDTKIMKKNRLRKKKRTLLESLAQKYYACGVFLLVLASIVSLILYANRSSNTFFFLDKAISLIALGEMFLKYLILYCPSLPIGLYFTLDVIALLKKLSLEREFSKSLTGKLVGKRAVHIYEPDALADLGQVRYVFLDKTGTFTTGAYSVNSIYLPQKFFNIPHFTERNSPLVIKSVDKKDVPDPAGTKVGKMFVTMPMTKPFDFVHVKEVEMNFNERGAHMKTAASKAGNGGHSEEEEKTEVTGNAGRRLAFRSLKDVQLDSTEFIQDVRFRSPELFSFLEAATLCHTARPKSTENGRITYDAVHAEEKTILEFTSHCDYHFEKSNRSDNPTEYYIRIGNRKIYFNIFAQNFLSEGHPRFSVLVKDSGAEDNFTLFVRGEPSAMMSRLLLEPYEKENLEKVFARLSEEGTHPFIYARKQVSLEDVEKYMTEYQDLKTSLLTKEEELEQLADQLESELSFVSVVGVQESLRPDSLDAIRLFREIDAKIFLVTGDRRAETMNTAVMLGLLPSPGHIAITTDKPLEFEATDYNSTKMMVRAVLSDIMKEMKSEEMGMLHTTSERIVQRLSKLKITNNRRTKRLLGQSLTISGATFHLILADTYLTTHFAFILSFCRTVVGHGFTPAQKGKFVKLVKRYRPSHGAVLAVGEGFDDTQMMQQAHISIEVRPLEGGVSTEPHSSDIIVPDFATLRDILLILGKNYGANVRQAVHYMFYSSMLQGLTIFLYQWYCRYAGTTLKDSMFVFLYSFIFTLFPIIAHVVSSQPFNPRILQALPALYVDVHSGSTWRRGLLSFFVDAVAHSCVIYYVNVYIVGASIAHNGHTPDFGMLSLSIIYTSVLANFKAFSLLKSPRLFLWALVGEVFLAGFVLANWGARFTEQDFEAQTVELFSRVNSVLSMIYTLLTCAVLTHLIVNYLERRYITDIYDLIARENASQPRRLLELKNEDVLARIRPPLKIGKVILRCFIDVFDLDIHIQELIHPGDTAINQLGIHPLTLRFKNRVIERMYSSETLRKSLPFTRVMVLVEVLAFGIYLLIDSLVREQIDAYFFVRVGVFVAAAMLSFYIFLARRFDLYYNLVLFPTLLLLVGVKIFLDFYINYDVSFSAVLLAVFSCANFRISAFAVAVVNTLYLIAFLIQSTRFYSLLPNSFAEADQAQFYITASYFLQIVALFAFTNYKNFAYERDSRSNFLSKTRLAQSRKTSNDFLSILVPKFVKDKMEQGIRYMAEDGGEVVILFCYICEFDKMISKVGTSIIEILDILFRTFDGFCANHGIQKIETVGYTYLACAGLRSCESGVPAHLLAKDPNHRIVEMAVEMMDYVKTRRIGGIKLKMKVGVHRGHVIAGVIGFHKPQFSLVGDTVNTTSRICATTIEGAIAISAPVYELVKDTDFRFIERKVFMKGKGDTTTYVCEKKRYLWRDKLSSALRKEQMIVGVTRKQMNALRKLATTNQDVVKQKLGSIIKAKTASSNSGLNPRLVSSQVISSQKTIVERRGTIAQLNSEIALDNSDMQGEDHLDGFAQDEERFRDRLLSPSWLLTFDSRQSTNAEEFNRQLDKNKLNGYTYLLVIIFMVHLLQTTILFSVKWIFPYSNFVIAVRFGFNLLLISAIMCRRRAYSSTLSQAWVIIMYVYGVACVLLETGLMTPDSNERNTLEGVLMNGFHHVDIFQVVFIMTIAMFSNGIFFLQSILLILLIAGCWVAAFLANEALDYENVAFFVIFSAFLLIQKYRVQSNDISAFNNIAIKMSRKGEEEELVSNLLPLHIAEKYFSNRSGSKLEFTNSFQDVTMLFADIKGFTDYSAGHEPKQVVEMLSELFTEFDKKCFKFGLYKLYTIGDCYVCMSFNDARNRNPGKEALNMVRFSLSLLEIISRFRQSRGLDMRIGLHTGECIGGVIGTDIVRYDFYGRDVLVANKMESNGVEGKIHISETTRNLLDRYCPGMFRYEYHGMVEAKSLNFAIEGYMLYENMENHEEGQERLTIRPSFYTPEK